MRLSAVADVAVAAWETVVSAIGPEVRAARHGLGLSLQQLAAPSEVSAAAIHKRELTRRARLLC